MAELNLGHVVGPGVPTGGTAGQVLKKNSSTNFDTSWSANDATTIPMSSSNSTSINQAIAKLNVTYIESQTSFMTLFNGMAQDSVQNFYASNTNLFTDYPSSTINHVTYPFIRIEKRVAVGTITIQGYHERIVIGYIYGTTLTWSEITNVQNGLAYIVGDTNTTGSALSVGQFVYVKEHSTIAEGLRMVTASISSNGNITTSNTSACSDGGLNALNSKIVSNAITVTDFNDVITPGTYQARSSSTATNTPNPSVPGRWYNLSVFANADGEITQLAYTTSYGFAYIRGRASGGVWTSWQELALNSNTVPSRKTITLNNSRDVAFGVLTANSNLRLWIPHQINLADGSNGSVTSASITYAESYVNGSDVVVTQSITGLNNGSYSAYGIVLNLTGSYGSLGIPLNTPMICPVKGTIVLE